MSAAGQRQRADNQQNHLQHSLDRVARAGEYQTRPRWMGLANDRRRRENQAERVLAMVKSGDAPRELKYRARRQFMVPVGRR
jgi:hypothetical protein